ncbi:MAG: ATP-binding protein [Bacteroidales bacterium]|nr:ATP-binding protein [Bacteroidales bacterium]
MINEELIKEIIFDFQNQVLPEFTRRNIDFTCPPNKIRTLIGARRVGKTYSFYQLIQDLLGSGVEKTQILFINFEDERLIPLDVTSLSRILEIYYETYPAHKDKTVHLFFDEIQNVDQWEIFIRRVHERENVQINLTGSSSKLMSMELATSLRGRTLAFEVFPFSFSEYLRYKNIPTNNRSSKNRSFIINAFNLYIFAGGFPEIINVTEPLRIKILQDYFNLVLYRDLLERYEIRNYSLIKYLLKYILANNANPFSVNKAFGDIKSQGYKVSKDTLHNYLAYMEDAFCLSLVSIFSDSIRKQHINYRKIYAIDQGLVTSLVNTYSYNTGRLLETLVYNQLRRKFNREQIFYYKTTANQEVDFLVHDRGDISGLYQVCESMEDISTKTRETSALWLAMDELALSQSIIITRNEHDKIEKAGKTIRIIPFWDWAISV